MIELVRIGRCDDEEVLKQFNHELILVVPVKPLYTYNTLNNLVIKMEEKKMFDNRKERERFLTDPILSALDDQLVRIHLKAIPIYIISNNEVVERKYNPETRALVGKIEKEKEKYIEAKYGVFKGDIKWQ